MSTWSQGEAPPPEEFRGLAGSPGIAAGPLWILDSKRPVVRRRRVGAELIALEERRFSAAVTHASDQLREVVRAARARSDAPELSILDAYLLMLADPTLRAAVVAEISERRRSAEWAIDVAVAEMAARLRASEDAYFRDRSRDFESVGEMLCASLSEEAATETASLEEAMIVVANDLSPAQTAAFDKRLVIALITEVGSRSSHTAILARALDIPAVVGCTGVVARAASHESGLVLGSSGRVILSPSMAILKDAQETARNRSVLISGLQRSRDVSSATGCGVTLALRANIELPHEVAAARAHGAEGVGLYRTEFLFMGRPGAPSEDEQYAVYRSVLEQCPNDPVVLRTFDLGGDKFPSTSSQFSGNQELGFRGLRLALAHPDVLQTQLRAMLRASCHGDLSILVPMVTTESELEQVRRLLSQAAEDVDEKGGGPANGVRLGCMIEVPSAALNSRFLAQHVDFLSIGTNDLVQYACAVDRRNTQLSGLASHFDPGVLKLIASTLEGGASAGRPVSVCGAMASDPFAAIVLVGLGVRVLSMEASAIPTIKETLRRVLLSEAEAAARAALEIGSAGRVQELLRDRFQSVLGELAAAD